jgi:hypothetical protein
MGLLARNTLLLDRSLWVLELELPRPRFLKNAETRVEMSKSLRSKRVFASFWVMIVASLLPRLMLRRRQNFRNNLMVYIGSTN